MSVWIGGVPRGAGSWRKRVADGVAPGESTAGRGASALRLGFVLRPRQFVDLDTLVVATVGGLRDAGLQRRGLPGLDVVLATKSEGEPTGAALSWPSPSDLAAEAVPGPALLDVVASSLPGPRAEGKRAWRAAIEQAWGGGRTLTGPVWAEVAIARPGSLLAPLEPVLDALEPVLGRDPRGRPWQEFFPADDRIVWLRLLRGGDVRLRLRLGPAAATAV